MNHPLQCKCGKLKGHVSPSRKVNRVVCYCKDCQAFAHFLGRAGETLNDKGGTDIVQMRPGNVTFSAGVESLACVRLSEKGLLRWYAACCNTPVGNTLATHQVSFVGVIHNCLDNGLDNVTGSAASALDDSFGPVRGHVNTGSAIGGPSQQPAGTAMSILRFVAMVLRARIGGDYKNTPFFRVDSGEPIVKPRVLSRGERERLANTV